MGKRGVVGKGQVSMEFLIVIVLAFLLIIPLVSFFIKESQSAAGQVNLAQIGQISRKIAANAETVYAFGEPTTFTLVVTLPQGVEQIYFGNRTIFFVVNNQGRISSFGETLSMNVTGNISTYAGLHRIRIQAINNSVVISEILT